MKQEFQYAIDLLLFDDQIVKQLLLQFNSPIFPELLQVRLIPQSTLLVILKHFI